ncbi:MAG: hypothetical protein K6A80_03155 [Saccharofermentans sp.]|nr:hypothetical protein [Saccharofermentans sp.]
MYRDKINELIKESHNKLTEEKEFGESELQSLEPRIDFAEQIIKTLEDKGYSPDLRREGYRINARYDNYDLYILNSDPDSMKLLTPYIKDTKTGNSYQSFNTSVDDFVNLLLWLKGDLEAEESKKVKEESDFANYQIRVIRKIREERYKLDEFSGIDEAMWRSDFPKWKDRIDFAAKIIQKLEERNIFVLLFSNGYYLTVSRPEKIYESFRLSVLDLDLESKDQLIPYVKDSGSGISYKTENIEIDDFIDLFLWTTGDLETDKCKKVIAGLGKSNPIVLTERKKNLDALIGFINTKISSSLPDIPTECFYKLNDKGSRWEMINPAEIVSKLEDEGAKFERTLWLAIKRHEGEKINGKIKRFELTAKDEEQKKYNNIIKNNCLFFNEEGARELDSNDPFENEVKKAVITGLLITGYKESNIYRILIDDQGIIRYSAVLPFTDKNGERFDNHVTGYLGQVLSPDKHGLIKTRHHEDSKDDYWFVPGYYAVVNPSACSIENNTRLIGYQNMICAAIKIQLIRDRRLIYDYANVNPDFNKRNKSYTSVRGDTTNLNDVYSLFYEERFDYDPLGEDIGNLNALPKDIREAIVKTLARRVRYPEYLYERSGVNALLKDEDSICMIRNTKIFDPEATSSGKNQGLVRYLVEGAKVKPDGSIVPGKDGDRTPIFNPIFNPIFKNSFLSEYSKYNPFDRNQMVFSNLMKAYSITAPAKTALTTCGGWNMEDGFVVSKEFAHKNQVIGIDGKMRDLKIGDKMLDRGGNKGVISIIVDRKSRDKTIAGLVKLFRENPGLDVVASPYSGLSRFNGATARELMKDTSSLFYDGKEHKNCIGKAEYIITRHFADKKTHIYDEEDYDEGRSRKASPQLSWALCSKDAKRLMSYLYAEGKRAEEDIKSIQALMYYKNDYQFEKTILWGELLDTGFDVYNNDCQFYHIMPDELLKDTIFSFCLLPYKVRKGFRLSSGKKAESKLTKNYQKLSEMLDEPKKTWNPDQIEKQAKKIEANIEKEFFECKENIFKTLVMTRAIDLSTTAIWSPDPRLSIGSVAISREISEVLGAKENDYLLIWRDPILRDACVRYMKIERVDDNLTGIAINPVVAKGFDGDFDGDTVAVVRIRSEKADLEAREKFSVENNLFDEGKPGEQLILNTKLDLISAGLVLPENKSIEDIDSALQETFQKDYVLDNATIVFRDEKSVIGSMRMISESKAKGGSLDNFKKYFECNATEDDRLAVQKATAIKSAVGIAGMFSQQLMRAFRDVCPKAVLEITYPNTQALLQAKHDPERAVEVYKILQNRLMNAWNDDTVKRKERIRKIYDDLEQGFGKEIDEKYLDEVCSALGSRKLKDCTGAVLDELAYNKKYILIPDTNNSKISILRLRQESEERYSEYCKLFFEKYDENE